MGRDAKYLICNCENSMNLDERGLEKALEGRLAAPLCSQLCRAELYRFQEALKAGGEVAVACTQEAALFETIAAQMEAQDGGANGPQSRAHSGEAAALKFFNIREMAGWSGDGKKALPKMLALAARATLDSPPTRSLTLASDGMCLIYADDDFGLEVAKMLRPHLPVAVLLREVDEALPLLEGGIPLAKGVIAKTAGSFGNFTLTVHGYAAAKPSSRDVLAFEPVKENWQASAALILDLTRAPALLPGGGRNSGYFKFDPAARLEIFKALPGLIDMVGEFEKPIYVAYRENLCAHSANSITACTKCLDHCPLGAVQPAGGKVRFDAAVCEGCGSCAAICPTGAASYKYPTFETLAEEVSVLLASYRAASGDVAGEAAHLLYHDRRHGNQLIEAMARFGDGLPAHVIPLDLHQVSILDHCLMLYALATGAGRITILGARHMQDELAALTHEVELAQRFLTGLEAGLVAGASDEAAAMDVSRIELIITDEPDELASHLWQSAPYPPMAEKRMTTSGEKRQILSLAVAALSEAAGFEGAALPLEAGDPYGKIEVDNKACTLCLACVGACPANALGDHPDKPQLTFTESACVQCGLCRKTCPENAISLTPRYDLTKAALSPAVLHEEEPYKCIRCGKDFGVRSTIEKITETLAAKHWMFETSNQIDLIKMCEDCRVIQIATEELNEETGRPRPRTTDDYLNARKDD